MNFRMANQLSRAYNFVPENADETMSNYASILLKDLNIKNILSTVLKPSPPDDQMDLLIDTLHEGESNVAEPDSNHAIRMILIERLIHLRKERNEFQTNIEQSVNLLLQIVQKSKDTVASEIANQSSAVKETKELLRNLLATAKDDRGTSKKKPKSNSSRSSSSSSDERRKRKRKKRRRSSSRSRSNSSDRIRKNRPPKAEERRVKRVNLGYELVETYQPSFFSVPPPPIYQYPPYLVLPPPPLPVPLFPGINPSNLVPIPSIPSVLTNNLNIAKMPISPPEGTKLMDVRSLFLTCAKDEHWSKFLVEQLDSASDEDKQIVFDEIFTTDLLITDKRGVQVLMKYLDVGTVEQKEKIVNGLKNKIVDMASTLNGSQFIMKCFDCASQDVLLELVDEFKKHVPIFSRNCNANGVLQKLINVIGNSMNLQFMVDELSSEIFFVSVHSIGSRLIETILAKFPADQIRPLVMSLCNHVSDLAVDKTGNYVIQYLLEFGTPDVKSLVIQSLSGNVVKYSYNKFASHVVEKAFRFATPADRATLTNEILTGYSSTSEDKCPLVTMMTDAVANYVVSNILDVLEAADPLEHSRLMNFIQPHVAFLSRSPHGRRIVAKFHKYCLTAYPNNQYNPSIIHQTWYS